MDNPWRTMIQPCWRRLMDTYSDPSAMDGFYESRPRRRGDPIWAYNWGFGALLAAAGAVCQAGAFDALTSTDWERLYAGLVGYRREKGGFASTNRRTGLPLGDTFYDDNAWIGLAALDLAEHPDFLGIPETTYRFLLQGMDEKSGGVFWKEEPKRALHVCSTGPTVVLAARLYHNDPEVTDLAPVWKMMGWLQHMRAPDGRYWDNEPVAGGVIDRALYTYNTGTPLQAMALLDGIGGVSFRDHVKTSVLGLSGFLDERQALPPTPWFNAVLLRGLLAVENRYDIASSLFPVYGSAMAKALEEFKSSDTPLHLPSQDDRDGIMLRDASAAVEMLALLSLSSHLGGDDSSGK